MSDTPAGGSTQQFTWITTSSTASLIEDGTNFYLYGPSIGSAPIEQINISGSTPSYLVSDTTGVREQLNGSGSVTGSMSYDSFGNQCSSCSIATPFGFAGGYTDSTGLQYLVDRYYDPTTGQFISVDPDVSVTGQPYIYTADDPVNETDPQGDMLPIAVTCPHGVCEAETSNGLGNGGSTPPPPGPASTPPATETSPSTTATSTPDDADSTSSEQTEPSETVTSPPTDSPTPVWTSSLPDDMEWEGLTGINHSGVEKLARCVAAVLGCIGLAGQSSAGKNQKVGDDDGRTTVVIPGPGPRGNDTTETTVPGNDEEDGG